MKVTHYQAIERLAWSSIKHSKTEQAQADVERLIGSWAEMRVRDSGRVEAWIPVKILRLHRDYGHMRWAVQTLDGRNYAVSAERMRVSQYDVPARRDGKIRIDMTA